MAKYFRCAHCQENVLENPRLKGKQLYCGSKPCQQARKNKWEKDKLDKDKNYRTKRLRQKSRWRKKIIIDQYQKRYRESHPDYVTINRCKQKQRNTKRTNQPAINSMQKIVKTDALSLEAFLSKGLYVITPCFTEGPEKIVKTDALIVELQSCGALSKYFSSKSR